MVAGVDVAVVLAAYMLVAGVPWWAVGEVRATGCDR